jgi:hypothetical protein
MPPYTWVEDMERYEPRAVHLSQTKQNYQLPAIDVLAGSWP